MTIKTADFISIEAGNQKLWEIGTEPSKQLSRCLDVITTVYKLSCAKIVLKILKLKT